jgi:hypothetical protein
MVVFLVVMALSGCLSLGRPPSPSRLPSGVMVFFLLTLLCWLGPVAYMAVDPYPQLGDGRSPALHGFLVSFALLAFYAWTFTAGAAFSRLVRMCMASPATCRS